MNSLKSLFLVFIAGILLTTCNQTDVEPEFLEVNEFVDPQSDAMLSDLLLNFSENDPSARFSDQLINETIGQILTNRIVKRISSPDQLGPVYSMPVVKDPNDNIKEWLVLEATENGYVAYILQYEYGRSFDLLNFSGIARVLDLERTVQSEEYFENGVQTSLERENGRTETTYTNCDCEWVTVETDVIGPITGEVIGTDTEVWLNCHCNEVIDAGDSSTGGGETGGIGTPIEGGSGPTGGGDGSSGGSGGTIGLPSECGGSGGFSGSNGNCASEEELAADQWERDNITTTFAFDRNPCASGVLTDLNENNIGYDLLTSFLGENPTMEVTLDLVSSIDNPNGDGIISAHTLPPNNGNIKIELSKQYLDQGRSNLEVARTLLHELIHAELWGQKTNLSNTDFTSLYKDFVTPIIGTSQHNIMAQYYVDRLASMMQEFDSNVNGQDFGLDMYKAGAWIGLEKTDLWASGLDQNEKDAIKSDQEILYNFREQCK